MNDRPLIEQIKELARRQKWNDEIYTQLPKVTAEYAGHPLTDEERRLVDAVSVEHGPRWFRADYL